MHISVSLNRTCFFFLHLCSDSCTRKSDLLWNSKRAGKNTDWCWLVEVDVFAQNIQTHCIKKQKTKNTAGEWNRLCEATCTNLNLDLEILFLEHREQNGLYTHTQRTRRDRCTLWTGWFAMLSIWPNRSKLHMMWYILEHSCCLSFFSLSFFF